MRWEVVDLCCRKKCESLLSYWKEKAVVRQPQVQLGYKRMDSLFARMANNSQYPGIQPPRPPVAPMGPPQSAYPPVPMQFHPAGPPRPPPPYMPLVSQQFLPVGRPNIGLPSQSQQLQLSQPMPHLPPRPGPPAHSMVPPPPPPPVPAPQAFSVPDGQPIRPGLSVSPQPQHAVPMHNNYLPGPSGPRVPLSLTYSQLSTSATAQIHVNAEATNQYQQTSSTNMPSFPLSGSAWSSDGQTTKAVTPVLQPAEQISLAPSVPVTIDASKAVGKAPSDWIEHTSRNGKRYYHNKKTKLSSWEKPLDLMSPIERADASTDWKEYTAPDGRKYYYNKGTKQSKWKMPDELKLARQQMKTKSSTEEQEPTKDPDYEASAPSVTGLVSLARDADSPSSGAHEIVSSPVSVAPLVAAAQSGPVVTAEFSTGSRPSSNATSNAAEGQDDLKTVPITSEETEVPATLLNPAAPALSNTEDVSAKDSVAAENGPPAGNIEESEKGNVINHGANFMEEKTLDQENQVYENKQDAKIAFKALLENANIASDWTWDQAMRVIINDRRYGALRTLSERKQAFNEFLGQKKKKEAEERRNRQKKAREEFKKMLDDSKEITSSTKWSKAIAIFEDDDRFKAVERSKDREDLFEDHIMELEKKERSKALEEHKRNRKEFIEFLKSCDFITASSQWRKVQDRLEADESCLRLEKVDRLEIFQEYVRDLEKDEEEQRKLRMEELRKTERKNREEFRKLMEGHIASGMLTSKTHWRDYCIKVKDLPAYLAVSSNSSGATPKDLFEDVIEELEKQYLEDRDQIKEAVKMRKVSISSTWTLEEFKSAIAEDISSYTISDVNLKLVFDELQERVREREEKETKRRKRLADDFYLSLSTSKEITSSSRWEDLKPLFEDRLESWFTVEESFYREIFDKYMTELKKARDERKHREEKAKKTVDRDRRTSSKSRRDKERGKKDKRRKEETDSDNGEENRRSGREKDKKHRKRHHQSYLEDMSLEEDEKEKDRSHRHSIERKRTKQQQLEQQSSATAGSVEYESRHKRYKRDHRHYDDQKEAEDGEVW
ncbi:pre-mRNA-processing protein 40A-like isoform X2 [Cynara cardunculus var. scolymus]|nr:pre-mRNA-processing protein 40A-like isoform X2 [Cynara cardunculus var. scolymus]